MRSSADASAMLDVRFALVTRTAALLLVAGLACPTLLVAQGATSARAGYQDLLARERALSTRGGKPRPQQLRSLIIKYEDFAGRHARTGYADNAIWQAAQLASMLASRTKTDADRRTAVRLLEQLVHGYPSSSLVKDAQAALRALTPTRAASAPAPRRASPVPTPSTMSAKARASKRAPAEVEAETETLAVRPAKEMKTASARARLPRAGPTPPRVQVPLASRDVLVLEMPKAYAGTVVTLPAPAPPGPTQRASARPTPKPAPVPARKGSKGTEPAHSAPTSGSPAELARFEPSPPPTREADDITDRTKNADNTSATEATAADDRATLVEIRRAVLPELVRVTLELNREVSYRDQKSDRPAHVAFDLPGTVPAAALRESVLTYSDDVVRQINIVEAADQSTRVVVDLTDTERYSVFTLYNPYRVVVDVFRKPGGRATAPSTAPALASKARGANGRADGRATATTASRAPTAGATARGGNAGPASTVTTTAIVPDEGKTADVAAAAAQPAPDTPETTSSGSFSIARQLGLGVSRIVIDPGHGGHDPGALGKKVTEAEVVLDVALRLEKLLKRSPAFDVVLTRRTDTFIPLEQRTALANRARADLFLSIHANASRNPDARGIETYLLNFASNPEAEAVAARENAASGRSMHQLNDIVKAIALNNKVDESREFARIVQTSLVKHLEAGQGALRDLGVKQAPFVVLVGAGMPSVLAEISFITNSTDAQLLKKDTYRQRIAESLFEAILKYQRTLKATQTVASKEE